MKYWQEALAVARRILLELCRRQRSLFLWVMFPVFVLLLNGYILADQPQATVKEAFEAAAPMTLVGAALFFSCLGGTVATVVSEREQQTLKRLFLTPLSGLSYFFGIFLAHSCIGIGQTLLVYTSAAFLQARFNGSLWLGGLIVLLSIIAYVGLGFTLGTQIARRIEDVNALVAAFGVPLLMLGGAFVPLSFLPTPLREIAKYNPVYHMNEALTRVSAAGDGIEAIAPNLYFLTGFALLMVISSGFAYRQMLTLERRL
ncbi:MAG: ABC transporter permease [Oscillatoriophycideae cyanobacterium NC_groundwater_1537_Pr4_S-0.65um_50_18]|nr:ABC transporter permease [Oscillatoriophycideae cyanobacterium NC_groundwater_1537_Pr4_S-0.65um_50_18]